VMGCEVDLGVEIRIMIEAGGRRCVSNALMSYERLLEQCTMMYNT
jgi:hypothetical protein